MLFDIGRRESGHLTIDALRIIVTNIMLSMTLKRGDRITLRVIATQTANDATSAAPQTVLTLPYLVTDEKVQSLWLSSN